MLDFTEIAVDGEGLELLVRELCIALDFDVNWSGRGADGGRDLTVVETGQSLFGNKRRSWLVSCKHTAHASGGRGRSVNGEDLGSDGGILDAVSQHGASGYLLVCSTQPSSALVARLESIEANRGVPVHIWDGVQLERMLTSPRGWAVAQRFMPVSAGGWNVFATEAPNKFVIVTRGFYIQAENRHGSKLPYQLESLDERLDAMARLTKELPPGHELRPRGFFCDDKHGWFVWYVDYLYGKASWRDPEIVPPVLTALEVARKLGDQLVPYSDGQWNNFRVTIRQVDRDSDAYDADHYTHYDDVGNL